MICELGCGDAKFFITDRCGQRIICELTNLNQGNWSRLLDETSEAGGNFTVGGTGESSCCSCLGNTRTWIHSLSVYRDGSRVWFGPITNLLYKRDSVAVTARDITAWFDKRVIHNNYNFVNQRLDVVIRTLLEDALGVDDPCGILNKMQIGDMPTLITKQIVARDGYFGDTFRDFARNYMDFTVIGDILVIEEMLSWGPFAQLTDEHFKTDLEIEERGDEAATKWYVNGNGVAGESTGDGIDLYYGLLEQVAAEDSVDTVAEATLAANNRLEASNPAPLYVNIPDGAGLSPKAPVCIEQLVPGTLMDVDIRTACRPVQYRGRLTAVKANYGNGDELMGVTVAPIGTTEGQGGRTVSRIVS